MLVRVLVIVGCALPLFAGCKRFTEAKLFGSWRAEDESSVDELAFHRDHTFTDWFQSKTELHTPGVIIEQGEWQLDWNQIALNPKMTNSVEPRKPFKLAIVKISRNTLITKTSDSAQYVTAKRLPVPACTPSTLNENFAIDAGLVGTWQTHYRTHDYEQSFNKDHSVTVSARIAGTLERIHAGTWRIEGNDIVMQLQSVSHGSVQDWGKTKWTIVGFGSRCVIFKDDGIAYVLERTK
jgi:hypothetical protein